MSGSYEQRSAPSPRLSSVQGHGCADPETVRAAVVPLDVAAIEDWTARNKAARDAYLKRVGECGKPTKRLTAGEQAELDATRDRVLARLADRDRN